MEITEPRGGKVTQSWRNSICRGNESVGFAARASFGVSVRIYSISINVATIDSDFRREAAATRRLEFIKD